MQFKLQNLIITLITCLVSLLCVNLWIYYSAPVHYIPMRKMQAALQAGDHCLVILGDSRTATLFDESPEGLENHFKKMGYKWCVADLSIGAGTIANQAVMLRHYLNSGKHPLAVAMGVVYPVGLMPLKVIPPESLNGNRAVSLIWSKPSDIWLNYPGAWWQNFDSKIRFLIQSTNAIAQYSSIAWQKVQTMQNKLVGNKSTQPSNHFGKVADMQQLAKKFTSDAVAFLNEGKNKKWKIDPWFYKIHNLSSESNTPLVFFQVPMPSFYGKIINNHPQMHSYMNWINNLEKTWNITILDLSNPKWLKDSDFKDGLHLSGKSAIHLLNDLASALTSYAHKAKILGNLEGP